MNAIGYTITALIVLACTAYLLLAPVWGRKKPHAPKWGRGAPLDTPSSGSGGRPAPPRRVIIEDQRASPRPQSAARMRSVRHETRKPRSPVRAVPDTLAKAAPTETPGDISTLLTIAAFDGAQSVSDCAPGDSSGSSNSGSCDSGDGDGGSGD